MIALEEAETFAVYRPEFERLREQHPGVDELLFRFLDQRGAGVERAAARRRYICQSRSGCCGGCWSWPSSIPARTAKPLIALTQETLAELAGASRATVNQVLREEEKRGAIELQRGKIRLLDVDALGRRAR